jgi:hypothetical protein
MGIRPDLVVEIHRDLLKVRGGPMLKYGLQQMQWTSITLPVERSNNPTPMRSWRYHQFKAS